MLFKIIFDGFEHNQIEAKSTMDAIQQAAIQLGYSDFAEMVECEGCQTQAWKAYPILKIIE